MKIVALSEVDIEAAAKSAATVLRRGGVILYPTDTLYGLGADALSDDAVAKVRRIKRRDEKKPIYAMAESLAALETYAEISGDARVLARAFWPGSLTLIFSKKPTVETGIARGIKTFGARASNNPFCLALARAFAKPYTATSANKSGKKPERSLEKILSQLGKGASDIDLVIDAGELPERMPSTVVDTRPGELAILREGSVSTSDVWDALRVEY